MQDKRRVISSKEIEDARKAPPALLRESDWQVGYSHEDGDLVRMFYAPVLSCAKLYQRATGFFSAGALSLAARGLDALMKRGGKMELLVGCTLNEAEIQAIKEGYEVREYLGKSWREKLDTTDPTVSHYLGYLAHMIAHGFLDVKIAIPLDERGEMRAGLGMYHSKLGLVTDEAGDRLAFKGSINETENGWLYNIESFEVSCSWRGDWELKKVEKSASEFDTLWSGKAKRAKVFDFPDALRAKLLEFLPKTDRPLPKEKLPEPEPEVPPEAVIAPDEQRERVWNFIHNAAKRPDGALVAVKTCMIEPWPHQLRAYKRMLDSWPFRLLIADEVGLGKTIEAGLIIRHAWISETAKRILIMAPKAVLKQWQSELYEKFNLLVPVYTGHSFVWPKHHAMQCREEEKVSRKEWTKAPLVLVSSHLMRRSDRVQELIDAEGWDLLVLDEAHHARRRGAGTTQENRPNRLLKLMQDIGGKAKSLLLMTATPMQVHPVELWDLLKLLGLPPEWTEKAFVDYFETVAKNPDAEGLFKLAKLFQATEKECGPVPEGEIARVAEKLKLSPIDRKRVLEALREPKTKIPLGRLSNEQRKAAIAILKVGSPVRQRMSRHTRHLLREYFKKGLLNSPIAERKVVDLPIELSPSERKLYDDVEKYISEAYQSATPDKKTAVGFVMTIYRRRLASSFFALRETLNDRLSRVAERENAPSRRAAVIPVDETRTEEDLPQDERTDEQLDADDAAALSQQALAFEERGRIQDLLKAIAKLSTDTKALKLVEHLKGYLSKGYDAAIVFTQYTDTLDFLKEHISERMDVPVGCYSGRGGEKRDLSGKWQSCSKEQVKRMLRERQIRILVCTDAAAEGLNLQSCGVLVNYDLPWNPMKVEQRIGRIDRIGQKHADIQILNLAYKDTVEADVYFALNDRIGLFNGVVGKLQPILARLPHEFEAAALEGTDRERSRHEAVQNIERLVREAQGAAFDIDEVSDADLKPPHFPPSPLEPSDLDGVLANPKLLPPGVEIKPLDSRTYALKLPGSAQPVRVTTSPAIFDEHFESHQLLLPDSPIYQRIRAMTPAVQAAEPETAVSLRKVLDSII